MRKILDLLAVAAPLGLFLGRLGCFCKGCCYGRISEMPWAVSFPKHVDVHGDTVGSLAFLRHLDQDLITIAASKSLTIHPAQIYSSLLSAIVFLVMLWLWKKKYAQNHLLFVYFIIYAVCRFSVEFFRDNQMSFAGLTIAQVFSIGIVLCTSFGLLFAYLRKTKVARE